MLSFAGDTVNDSGFAVTATESTKTACHFAGLRAVARRDFSQIMTVAFDQHVNERAPAMQFLNLGSAGVKVSRICLGTMTYGSKSWRPWVLDEQESMPFFRRAARLGHQFLRHGRYVFRRGERGGRRTRPQATRRRPREGGHRHQGLQSDGGRRQSARLSRKHIRHSIDNSLRRLGLDYVDLYQIHRFDPTTPIEETLEALD